MMYTNHHGLHLYNAANVTDLHELLCHRLAFGHSNTMDMITSVDVQQHNVIGIAEEFDYNWDLKDFWLTSSRWTAMVRQYINPVALDTWLNSIEAKLVGRKRGVSVMRTNEVHQRQSPTKDGDNTRVWRAWGSCMLAIGYRALPRPQITLHSRTSYLGYIGALDLSVAYVCAKLIAERVGLTTSDIQFVWHLEAAQFHGFKSMAYLMQDDARRAEFMAIDVGENQRNDKILRRRTPAIYISRKWMKSFENEDEQGKLYGDMNFGQTRRIRKRYHTEIRGYHYGEPFEGGGHASNSQNKRFRPLPSKPVDTLNFDCLLSTAARRSRNISWDESNIAKVDTTNEETDDALAG